MRRVCISSYQRAFRKGFKSFKKREGDFLEILWIIKLPSFESQSWSFTWHLWKVERSGFDKADGKIFKVCKDRPSNSFLETSDSKRLCSLRFLDANLQVLHQFQKASGFNYDRWILANQDWTKSEWWSWNKTADYQRQKFQIPCKQNKKPKSSTYRSKLFLSRALPWYFKRFERCWVYSLI